MLGIKFMTEFKKQKVLFQKINSMADLNFDILVASYLKKDYNFVKKGSINERYLPVLYRSQYKGSYTLLIRSLDYFDDKDLGLEIQKFQIKYDQLKESNDEPVFD